MRLRHHAPAGLLMTCAHLALANSGVQLSLNQYQAGQETTDSSLITNAGFESVDVNNVPTGWTTTPAAPNNIMIAQAPDPANLPNPASVLQTKSAQAFNASGVDPFNDYKLAQMVQLVPNTDYVLSAYIWNYGRAGPPPNDDLFAGDLAVVEVVDPNDTLNSSGLSVEPVALNGASGSRGHFIYKSFNSSQFPNGLVALEVELDPNLNVSFDPRPPLSAQFDNVAITPLTQFRAQVYNGAGAAWNNPAAWINGPANAPSAIASFTVPQGPANVSLGGTNQTVAVINFGAVGYAIMGPGTLTLDHEAARDAVIINNLGVSSDIFVPIVIGVGTFGNPAQIFPRSVRLNVTGATSVLGLFQPMTAANVGTLGAGTFDVRKTGAGRVDSAPIRARQLQVDEGTVRIVANATLSSSVSTLSIAGGAAPTARLDLTQSAMVVDYPSGEPSPLATTHKPQIISGYAGGAQIGNGIVSTGGAFATQVGYAEASELGAIPAIFGTVDSTALLLRGTVGGDSNLDGMTDISDFAVLAANFNTPGEWVRGNFNYDALVDIGDFAILATNFNRSVGDLPRAAVPEPASLGVVTSAVALSFRRSRRRVFG